MSESEIQKTNRLGYLIDAGEATAKDALEWMWLVRSGNPVVEKARQLVKAELAAATVRAEKAEAACAVMAQRCERRIIAVWHDGFNAESVGDMATSDAIAAANLEADSQPLLDELAAAKAVIEKLPGSHCLNVSVAGSIVMFDRVNAKGKP